MKLHRFCGTLLDLELISTINCSAKYEGEYGNHVLIHITFILGAPEIRCSLTRGSGLGGGERDKKTVEYYQTEITKLEEAWANCGRVIRNDAQ